MPSLNVDLDYFDHPKTKRLIGLLGRGAEVLPLKLWRYCGKYHAETGRLTDSSPEAIESIVDWWGQPGRCADALTGDEIRAFGFWEGSDFVLHNWHQWQGHLAAYRERGKKAALARWEKIRGQPPRAAERAPPAILAGAECNKHATSIAQASPKHCQSKAEQNLIQTVAAQPATDKPSRAARKPRTNRILTPEQERIRMDLGNWWSQTEYPRTHDRELYDFEGGRDGPAILKILRHQEINWDLEAAKKLLRFFVSLPEFQYPGHRLWRLMYPGYFIRKMKQHEQGDTHVIGINNPGAGDGITIPTRTRASEQSSGAAPGEPPPARAAG